MTSFYQTKCVLFKYLVAYFWFDFKLNQIMKRISIKLLPQQ